MNKKREPKPPLVFLDYLDYDEKGKVISQSLKQAFFCQTPARNSLAERPTLRRSRVRNVAPFA
jgi:hypothetical protein